ncbi:MAG: hypothetical protein MK100_06120 [Phycisphaerales bacterium]|nr:hypothetical protein [Phycisphaerales bacterium]
MNGILLALILVAAAPQAPRESDGSAFRRIGIEPIVRPEVFHLFVQDLKLGPEEAATANMLFEDYGHEMRTALAELQISQKQERDKLDDALKGRLRLSPEELRDLRMSLRTGARDACGFADRRVSQMIDYVTLLSTLDTDAKNTAIGTFQRRVYLDGGDREALVDVSTLIPSAMLTQPSAQAALSSYLNELTLRAKEDALAVRSARFEDEIAVIRKDPDERRSILESISRRWCERMSLHDRLMEAVGATDSTLRRRIEIALFPTVYGRGEIESVVAWIDDNGTSQQAATARNCVESAEMRLENLRREAVALLREAREAGCDLDHDAASLMSDSEALRFRYLQNSGERSVLEQNLFDCVQQELTEGQRAAIRRVVQIDRR